MKGTLIFSVQTSRTLEELQEQYPQATINLLEEGSYEIIEPMDNIDPQNPLQAYEAYLEETGEDCFEVFTITLENGKTFTEEDSIFD